MIHRVASSGSPTTPRPTTSTSSTPPSDAEHDDVEVGADGAGLEAARRGRRRRCVTSADAVHRAVHDVVVERARRARATTRDDRRGEVHDAVDDVRSNQATTRAEQRACRGRTTPRRARRPSTCCSTSRYGTPPSALAEALGPDRAAAGTSSAREPDAARRATATETAMSDRARVASSRRAHVLRAATVRRAEHRLEPVLEAVRDDGSAECGGRPDEPADDRRRRRGSTSGIVIAGGDSCRWCCVCVVGAALAEEGHEDLAEHVEGGEARDAQRRRAQSAVLPCGLENACHRISSFEKKPASGGMPAIASVAIEERLVGDRHATCRSPPIFRMSCSPPMAWMTLPEPRKRQALKKACVIRWKMPAAYAPTPMARNM